MQSQIENDKPVVGLNTGGGGRFQDLQDNRSVKARSVLCYWAIRELDENTTALAEKPGLTQPAVSISVKRGEKVAKDMRFDLNFCNLMDAPVPRFSSFRTLQSVAVASIGGSGGRKCRKVS